MVQQTTLPFAPVRRGAFDEIDTQLRALEPSGSDEPDIGPRLRVIADRLLNPEDSAIEERCRQRVAALCERFPLYAGVRELQPA